MCHPTGFVSFCAMLASSLVVSIAQGETPTAAQNYATHCVACHGEGRLGGAGPALLPENLERLRKPQAMQTIRDGRVATQMAAFGDKLSAAEVQALVDIVYTPPEVKPVWAEAEIRASRIEHVKPDSLPAKPVFAAD